MTNLEKRKQHTLNQMTILISVYHVDIVSIESDNRYPPGEQIEPKE